jgi:hypothetical protein
MPSLMHDRMYSFFFSDNDGRSEREALRSIWKPAKPFRHDVGRGAPREKPAVAGGFFVLYESGGRTIRGRTLPGAAAATAASGKVRPLSRRLRARKSASNQDFWQFGNPRCSAA